MAAALMAHMHVAAVRMGPAVAGRPALGGLSLWQSLPRAAQPPRLARGAARAAFDEGEGGDQAPPPLPIRRRVGGGIGMRKTASQMMGSDEPEAPPEPEPEPPCETCSGTGRVLCKVCNGVGRVPAGGFHKKNRVDLGRVVGSKWTAMVRTLGWTHFEVRAKRKAGKKDTFVEMVATCDDSKRLWVNANILKDKDNWLPGWVQKDDLRRVREGTAQGKVCGLCAGEGRAVCKACDGGDLLLIGSGGGGGRGKKKRKAKGRKS